MLGAGDPGHQGVDAGQKAEDLGHTLGTRDTVPRTGLRWGRGRGQDAGAGGAGGRPRWEGGDIGAGVPRRRMPALPPSLPLAGPGARGGLIAPTSLTWGLSCPPPRLAPRLHLGSHPAACLGWAAGEPGLAPAPRSLGFASLVFGLAPDLARPQGWGCGPAGLCSAPERCDGDPRGGKCGTSSRGQSRCCLQTIRGDRR